MIGKQRRSADFQGRFCNCQMIYARKKINQTMSSIGNMKGTV